MEMGKVRLHTAGERLALVQERLEAKPDGVLEVIAREVGVPTQVVLEATPENQRRSIPANAFEEVWRNIAAWGDVMFIVHTSDIILECKGSLPLGRFAHGYYNIHGDSPIGGHVRAENCRSIYMVDRLFHGRRSCSIQFFNGEGEAMFKIFVRRSVNRELLSDQVVHFESLWRRSFD